MQKKSILFIVVSLSIMATILYFTLRDKHDHSDEEHHDEVEVATIPKSDGAKEVELTNAQFRASEITFGAFSRKNLSDVISANGYTKLPPQNEAEVSVYTSGTVRNINIIEGQAVKKGQLLATIESPQIAQMQQEFKVSQQNLSYLKTEYDRQKKLSDEGVNSRKTFQKATSDYESEKARFNSLQRQMALMNIKTNATATTSASVLAPISGFVTEINIKIGSNVESGKSLLSIVDNSQLHVDLLVYEKDLGKVHPGQNVRFILTNQNDTEIIGKIFSVGKAFENETKSVAVHADIKNEKQQLIPGMYVNALIDIGSKLVDALPLQAIVKADGREFIFIREDDHEHDVEKSATDREDSYHFKRVEVKTGTSQLGYVQVTALEKLNEDAQIVLTGAYYLQSHLIKNEGGGGHSH